MQLTVQGKQIDLGDALRVHVEEKIEDLNEKFFNHATHATVTFSREGHGHGLVRCHISISIGKNINVMADGVEGDPYLAFDTAIAKAASQLRRYKNRLRDTHERMERAVEESTMARDLTLGEDADEGNEEHPPVIAELTTEIQTLSVSEAVMLMDLAGQPAMLFRNASHNGLNMVYRRKDGNIGWVDAGGEAMPQSSAKKAEKARRA